ncbi:Scr1 family TA system antitoxin-like transcriptional regulator [Streptomyces sp. NPDC047860]
MPAFSIAWRRRGLVLDEAVLRRPVGGRSVMHGQLDRLKSRRP